MTKEEVLELLKEKLTISVEVSERGDWESEKTYTKVKVRLYLDGELISESSDYA